MRARIGYGVTLALAAAAGVGAALAVAVATAHTFALQIAPSAVVSSQAAGAAREAIVVTGPGRAVYTLSSDSRRHPACTRANGCWSVWPPVKASGRHPRAAPGIHGGLTVWRHGGITQLLLAGHPLYEFSGDRAKDAAGGEGFQSFGGIWHVVRTSRVSTPVGAGSGTGTVTGTTSTGTTSTPTYTYPPPPTTYTYPTGP